MASDVSVSESVEAESTSEGVAVSEPASLVSKLPDVPVVCPLQDARKNNIVNSHLHFIYLIITRCHSPKGRNRSNTPATNKQRGIYLYQHALA